MNYKRTKLTPLTSCTSCRVFDSAGKKSKEINNKCLKRNEGYL